MTFHTERDYRAASPVSSVRRLFPVELDHRLRSIFPGNNDAPAIKRSNTLLSQLTRRQQDTILHWMEVISHISFDLAFRFAERAPDALTQLDKEGFNAWALGVLESYDKAGREHALVVLHDIEGFLLRRSNASAAASLSANEERLLFFMQALHGKLLKLKVANTAWTNGETLFLPVEIAAYPDAKMNRRLYKVLAAMLWAQTHYGTFDASGVWPLQKLIDNHGPNRVMPWLELFEAVRLEARIAQDLPGLAREIKSIREPWPDIMYKAVPRLQDPEATVLDSLKLVREFLRFRIDAPVFSHTGTIDMATALRLMREHKAMDENETDAVSGLSNDDYRIEDGEGDSASDDVTRAEDTSGVSMNTQSSTGTQGQSGQNRVMVQDYEFLEEETETGETPDFLYDEWDFRRGAYRRDWCQLYEVPITPGDVSFVAEVEERYRNHIKQIHRQLEMIRGEDKVFGRQPDGDEMDLDALVESFSERKQGGESATGLFRRRLRKERSMAVMFMVDMSGSTKGWVNDAERAALVMLCEAVERLGDNYAIYGFSGWGRTRCEIYPVKRFGEPYNNDVRARIAGIEARNFTRMGVAVRHLSKLLHEQPARHKLLVTISDGYPDDDGDDYRSRYGIEDTRRAIQEAHERGVRSFCITIDRKGADYLDTLYGPAHYEVIDDPQKLPLRVADIYRHLTT